MITLTLFSPIIFYLYTFGLLLGTLYSVPPIQFKKNAIAAGISSSNRFFYGVNLALTFSMDEGITIATVRGSLLNFGAFYATREALQLPFEWTPAALFLLIFNTIFGMTSIYREILPQLIFSSILSFQRSASRWLKIFRILRETRSMKLRRLLQRSPPFSPLSNLS